MKKFLVSALALGLMSGMALAQDTSNSQAAAPAPAQTTTTHHSHRMAKKNWHGKGMKKMDPAAHADMLAKKLGLSDDQKAKVQSIFEDQQKQMESMKSDTSMSKADRHSKMKEMHENTMTQVRAVLNPDQQKKFDEMKAKMAARHEKRESKREEKNEKKGGATSAPDQTTTPKL